MTELFKVDFFFSPSGPEITKNTIFLNKVLKIIRVVICADLKKNKAL